MKNLSARQERDQAEYERFLRELRVSVPLQNGLSLSFEQLSFDQAMEVLETNCPSTIN